jgi:hypothetical protein
MAAESILNGGVRAVHRPRGRRVCERERKKVRRNKERKKERNKERTGDKLALKAEKRNPDSKIIHPMWW